MIYRYKFGYLGTRTDNKDASKTETSARTCIYSRSAISELNDMIHLSL